VDYDDELEIIPNGIGERLRAIRRQKRLSLQEVEAMSGKEFKASVLGAYERGERAISVPRLLRLASVYGVPPEQLLPRDEAIDLTEERTVDLTGGFSVDLVALQGTNTPEAQILRRYAERVQIFRQDFNGRVLTIRSDDVRVMAWALGLTPEEMGVRLEEMGVRAVSV
jgi:transcriptional regulator with XRE-family HTH domain